ncbi:MAG TPA: oxygenase MpaB family protein [Puia sp.]|nr:oxygenase MpaB family protein [Puia sp.]
MAPFAHPSSIVRTIWGRGDTVLLIFAGASAEFALNRSVDWLYFTGKLPADPLGRLFSTVAYAQQIVFAEEDRALAAIDNITAIHRGVEEKRGASIPATAYLDVLFMLIGYSISSFELLERRLTVEEKAEVFAVFERVGRRMGLTGMPEDFGAWERMRARYLKENLAVSNFSHDLYRRYRKSLGAVRYFLLVQAQVLLVPGRVRRLLDLPSVHLLYPVVQVYKLFRWLRLDKGIKILLLPPRYRAQVFGLDQKMG